MSLLTRRICAILVSQERKLRFTPFLSSNELATRPFARRYQSTLFCLLCSYRRAFLVYVLRHLFSPLPPIFWPYVSVALSLVGLNKETGLSIPSTTLSRALLTGATEFGPAYSRPVQWQRGHQRNQPRCMGKLLVSSPGRLSSDC